MIDIGAFLSRARVQYKSALLYNVFKYLTYFL